METKKQLLSDLKSLISSETRAAAKDAINSIISMLQSKTTLEISESNPFLLLFQELVNSQKKSNNILSWISVIRKLIEINSFSASAISFILENIEKLLPIQNETISLKILQLTLSVFLSKSNFIDPRIKTSKWVFSMIYSSSVLVQQVAEATSYQITDALYTQITGRTIQNSIKSERIQNFDDTNSSSSSHQMNAQDFQIVPEDHWAVKYFFILVNDILFYLNNLETKEFTFKDTKFPSSLLKHILDYYFDLLSRYEEFAKTENLLYKYVNLQTAFELLSLFSVHLIIHFTQTDQTEAKQLFLKLMNYLGKTPLVLDAIAAIVSSNPYLQHLLFTKEQMLQISQNSISYFLSNFKGNLTEEIKLYHNNGIYLKSFDPYNPNQNRTIISCIVIIYFQILQIDFFIESFHDFYNNFEFIWQRVIHSTNNYVTLNSSLEVSLQCITSSLKINDIDPANRIFASICGLAVPESAAYPLEPKGFIALKYLIRITKTDGAKLCKFWPLIFETISKCYHTASHKRSNADIKALGLIQPSLISFSSNLENEKFIDLFNIILNLCKNDLKVISENKSTVPNHWPIKTLCYVFLNNIQRTNLIENDFFDFFDQNFQCESTDCRLQAVNSLFEISKAVLNSKEAPESCRRYVYDTIFIATNSSYRDVSVTTVSYLPSFLAEISIENMSNDWIKILTILKVVWTTPFPENIQNGFRALTYICNDCIMNLQTTDLEVCLSTISTYISQDKEINIALGSIGLLWNIGTTLLTNGNSATWKYLFKTIMRFFNDTRINIQESSLQTFFNLVNTFYQQFNEDLLNFIINMILHPLIFNISQIESSLMVIQGIIQCCQCIGGYDELIDDLLLVIYDLSMNNKSNSSIKAGEITRSFITLLLCDNIEVISKSTNIYLKIVENYVKNPNKFDLHGCSTVLSETFPKIADKIDSSLFNIWIKIMFLFCTFQLDKPFLHVATHSVFNAISNLRILNVSKLLELIDFLLNLLEYKILITKSIDSILSLYSNSFVEENRCFCLKKILCYFDRFDINYIQKFFEFPISLDMFLNDSLLIKDLIVTGRNYNVLKNKIIQIIEPKMNLLNLFDLNLFVLFGLQKPVFYTLFFKCFCQENNKKELISFAFSNLEMIQKGFDKMIMKLINEEKIIRSVLDEKKYIDFIEMIKEMLEIEIDPQIILECDDFIQTLLKLCTTKNETLSQETIKLVQKITQKRKI